MASRAEPRICKNCAHFHPTDKDRLAGECHHDPPQMFMDPSNDFYSGWPKVVDQDWCSSFSSAKNAY